MHKILLSCLFVMCIPWCIERSGDRQQKQVAQRERELPAFARLRTCAARLFRTRLLWDRTSEGEGERWKGKAGVSNSRNSDCDPMRIQTGAGYPAVNFGDSNKLLLLAQRWHSYRARAIPLHNAMEEERKRVGALGENIRTTRCVQRIGQKTIRIVSLTTTGIPWNLSSIRLVVRRDTHRDLRSQDKRDGGGGGEAEWGQYSAWAHTERAAHEERETGETNGTHTHCERKVGGACSQALQEKELNRVCAPIGQTLQPIKWEIW